MDALRLAATWPVPHVTVAAIEPSGATTTFGDPHRRYRLASITKLLTTLAALVAVEEGSIDLAQPLGQPGCTVRHLLAHAGGYGFIGAEPVSRPGTRRIYSNTGIEMVAAAVADAAAMPFDQYLREAVLLPLGMVDSELRGSPAYGLWSTANDLLTFLRELQHPSLVAPETAAMMSTAQYPQLAGLVPGVGRFDPCPWGLGAEIHGDKHPHWMGEHNSPAAFGHFGGAGTFAWVDPQQHVACLALTDREFDDWAADALQLWPQLSDAVLAEAAR